MVNMTLVQHPVGQGGMMSGRLQATGAGRFHWVYDCGSNQRSALNREIDVVAMFGDIDCLFVSHLDSDHISGIDRLLGRVRAREVVLPYLNEIDSLVALTHDITTGNVTASFADFLSDTAGWLGQRGVERITYVMPRSDDDGEGDGPNLPDNGERAEPDTVRPEWSPPPVDLPGGKTVAVAQRQINPGSYLKVLTGTGQLDWIFVPYAHRPSPRALLTFMDEFRTTFNGAPANAAFLSFVLCDASARSALRACYDLIWSDHNLVSMALYAGPVRQTGSWEGLIAHRHCDFEVLDTSGGWLCTGDMHLNVRRRQKAFLAHYRQLLDAVRVFCLPHHGSHLNFDLSLLEYLPNAHHILAATGPNSYGHPSKVVRRGVVTSNREFVKVTHKPSSTLKWRQRAT